MKFWASAEVYLPALSAVRQLRSLFEPLMVDAFAESKLQQLSVEFCYMPIVMPDGMRERYPARSRVDRAKRVFDCCPQLTYEVFISGSFESQLAEYVRGIVDEADMLAELGLTGHQVSEFRTIVASVAEDILRHRGRTNIGNATVQ